MKDTSCVPNVVSLSVDFSALISTWVVFSQISTDFTGGSIWPQYLTVVYTHSAAISNFWKKVFPNVHLSLWTLLSTQTVEFSAISQCEHTLQTYVFKMLSVCLVQKYGVWHTPAWPVGDVKPETPKDNLAFLTKKKMQWAQMLTYCSMFFGDVQWIWLKKLPTRELKWETSQRSWWELVTGYYGGTVP